VRPDISKVLAKFRAEKFAILLNCLLEVLQHDRNEDLDKDHTHYQDVREEIDSCRGLIPAAHCLIYLNNIIF
jgi:hypothetical protein